MRAFLGTALVLYIGVILIALYMEKKKDEPKQQMIEVTSQPKPSESDPMTFRFGQRLKVIEKGFFEGCTGTVVAVGDDYLSLDKQRLSFKYTLKDIKCPNDGARIESLKVMQESLKLVRK